MKVFTDKDEICVELHGREQFWALRAKVRIPRDTIKDVRFEESFQDWRKWQVRMPGTHAPNRLLAGSYWTEEGWDFLYIRRPTGFIKPRVDNVLVIETSEDKYKRIIVSCDQTDYQDIVSWWKKKSKKKK